MLGFTTVHSYFHPLKKTVKFSENAKHTLQNISIDLNIKLLYMCKNSLEHS